MSLGGGFFQSLNNAVEAAINAGITFVVAAGNSNANTKDFSPASVESAIVVGAVDSMGARAYFSNCGERVSIMAPGVNILSAWIGKPTDYATISGTSMASPPHVAGLAVLYLGESAYSC